MRTSSHFGQQTLLQYRAILLPALPYIQKIQKASKSRRRNAHGGKRQAIGILYNQEHKLFELVRCESLFDAVHFVLQEVFSKRYIFYLFIEMKRFTKYSQIFSTS